MRATSYPIETSPVGVATFNTPKYGVASKTFISKSRITPESTKKRNNSMSSSDVPTEADVKGLFETAEDFQKLLADEDYSYGLAADH